jgi:hypothetical protein
MVTADKLILEWDAFLTSFNDLWEIELEAIHASTWNTNCGGSSPLGTIRTKMTLRGFALPPAAEECMPCSDAG